MYIIYFIFPVLIECQYNVTLPTDINGYQNIPEVIIQEKVKTPSPNPNKFNGKHLGAIGRYTSFPQWLYVCFIAVE